MAISDLKQAAQEIGITAIVSNSRENIETQLNRITGAEQLPIMLVSWDLETELSFNEHGFLNNPATSVVALLMTKSESTGRDDHEKAAEEMAELFQVFLQKLNSLLVKYNTTDGPNITGAGYTLVPMHGMGKHSGVIGRLNMIGKIIKC